MEDTGMPDVPRQGDVTTLVRTTSDPARSAKGEATVQVKRSRARETDKASALLRRLHTEMPC